MKMAIVSGRGCGENHSFSSVLRKTVLSLLLLLVSSLVFAQKVITGQVVSSDDDEPLPGVTVIVNGTTRGTVTDIDGKYTLETQEGDEALVFSYVGYRKLEVAIGSLNVIDVSMSLDIEQLDEVIVVAYGVVRKSDHTGSISSIKAEDITSVPAASPVQALQGKVSGVRVVSNSGTPGEAPTVRIRGVGTFGDASPIYVVDGLILQDITFLNASDIKSMEVLKDASATALYGSRGANGVILVTTKTGSKGDKAVVEASFEQGAQSITQYIDMLEAREFAEVINTIQPGTFNNLSLLENTDWQQEVYRDLAPLTTAQISVRGGSEKVGYFVSAGYFDQAGIIPKSGFERFNVRINNHYEPFEGLKLGHNLNFTRFTQDLAPGVVASTLRAWPTDPARDENGAFFGNRGNGNPLAAIAFNNSIREGFRTVGNFYADIRFLKDFTFRTSYGIDYEFANTSRFTPEFFVTPQQQNPVSQLSKGEERTDNWLWENTLTWDKDLGSHRLNVLVGYTLQEDNRETLNVGGEDLIRDFITFLPGNLENITSVSNRAAIESRTSYLFRTNYVAFEKYLLTLSFRRDGSSRFSANNRWGNFPSVAVGWNISEEGFFGGLNSLIPYLKMKASYGVVGNDKIPVMSRFTLIDLDAGAVFGIDETLNGGATFNTSGNPNLIWEEAKQFNIGVEAELLNGRLLMEIDYYDRTTEGVLVPLQLPGHFGNGSFATTFFNAADVRNNGIDLNLGWRDQVASVNYAFGANISTVNNEVLQVTEGTGNTQFLSLGNLGNGQNVKRVEKGFPIGYFYGYKVIGIFQNEAQLDQHPRISTQGVGDFIYQDVNGDGQITPDDRTNIGSPFADLIYGFNMDFGYKGIEVSLDWQGELGKEIYNGKNAVRSGQFNYESSVINAWNGEGSSNSEPRITASGVNYSQSDWFIQDGSYLRLRTATISYNIPNNLLEKVKMTQARVYLRGTNVLTFTKYSGYTPEIGGDVGSSGIDTGLYPVTAIYSVGMNLTF